MGLYENCFAAREHEAENHRALARMRRQQLADVRQVFRLQMRRVQTQVNLLRVFFGRVGQRHDFLRENLRLVFAGADFADDEDRLVDFEQRAEFFVIIHHQQLHGPLQIFERDHRVGLAALF